MRIKTITTMWNPKPAPKTSKEFAERFDALWHDIAAYKPETWQNVHAIVVAFQALWVGVIEALTKAENEIAAIKIQDGRLIRAYDNVSRAYLDAQRRADAAERLLKQTEGDLQTSRKTLESMRTENVRLLADCMQFRNDFNAAKDASIEHYRRYVKTCDERDAWRRLHDAALESEDELRAENRKLRDMIRATMTWANPPNAFRRSGQIPARDWTAPTIRDVQRVYRSGELLKTPAEIENALVQGHILVWGSGMWVKYTNGASFTSWDGNMWAYDRAGLHYWSNGNENCVVRVA